MVCDAILGVTLVDALEESIPNIRLTDEVV